MTAKPRRTPSSISRHSMLGSLLNRPLELEVSGRNLRFDSKVDFEFALASRTEVPAGKISELMRFDASQLTEEASSVRRVERHFVEVLSQSIREPGGIGYLMREMDMKLFSQDHEWRAIMQAISKQPARFNEFKQLALVKYMQYLASRQDVLKGIYAFKVSAGAPVQPPDAEGAAEFRETVIFNVSDSLHAPAPVSVPASDGSDPAEDTPDELARIPRGEDIPVDVDPGVEMPIVLSRHPVALRLGDTPALLEENGQALPLKPGRNVLGRHPDSDVMLDASYRDVSRTHLIVDVVSETRARLTDLSSHGTFIPAHFLGAPTVR